MVVSILRIISWCILGDSRDRESVKITDVSTEYFLMYGTGNLMARSSAV